MKKMVFPFFFFFILFSVFAEEIRLKVNLTQSAPIVFADEHRNALGFFPEILNYIAVQEGWQLEYVQDTWPNSLKNLEEGKIDLMMSIARSEARLKIFDFTNNTVISNWGQLAGNKSVPIHSIEDLAGQKVAINKGNIHTKNLLELLDSFNIHIEPIYTEGYLDSFDLLNKGKVIAAVANRFNLLRYGKQYTNIEKTPIVYSPVNLYFATTKGKNAHILKTIDKYIEKAYANQTSFFYKAMDKWIGTSIAKDFKLPRWVGFSLYILGFIVITLTATALLLRSQVAKRTTELKQKNIELEKAKSGVEEEYQTLVENSPDIIMRFDGQFKHIYASPSVRKITDIPADSFVGKSYRELGFPVEQSKYWEAQIQKVFDEKRSLNTQFEFDGKNGKTIFDWRLIPEFDSDGKVSTVLSIARDITEHRRAEEALRDSEDKYRSLVETSQDLIWKCDQNGCFVFLNAAWEKTLGYKMEEMIGHKFNEFKLPELVALDSETFRHILKGDNVNEYETVYVAKSGARINLLFNAIPFFDQNGEVVGTQGTAHNITQRKKAEEALQESEERFRAFMDNLPAMAYIKDESLRHIYGNPAACVLFGRPLEEYIGTRSRDTVSPELGDAIEARDRRVMAEGITIQNDFSRVTRDGAVQWLSDIKFPITITDGRVRVGGIAFDITERKKAEEALRESEERYRTVADFTYDSEYWIGPDGSLIYQSPSIERITGYKAEEFLKNHPVLFQSIVHPDDKELFSNHDKNDPRSSDVIKYSFRIISKSGEVRWLENISQPVYDSEGNNLGRRGSSRDVTERKRAEEALRESEEQLRQAQKLESIGRLAGGVAHDFNNLLTTIIGYSELISMEEDLNNTTREGVQEIKNSAERAAALTQQLLAFSRKQVLQSQVIDINRLITKLGRMLRRLVSEDIDLTTKLDSNLGKIKADPGQVEQVIMNLVVNARDAMPEGGTLTIETQGLYLDESYHQQHPEVKPGDYVLLAVSDTGHGMDEETRGQIFEPFFTTKEVGKGTGLGLSTVYGIVKQSGGYIWVYSEPNHGTTVKIYLPQLTGTKKPQESLREKKDSMGGTETILLVEDEESLRKMAGKILAGYGYSVIEAKNGMEALEIAIKGDRFKIDLLVTDVIMPKMGGKELSEKLFEEYPKLKVLYISGYTDNAIDHHGMLDKGVLLLQKPFSPQSLAEKVREVLDVA